MDPHTACCPNLACSARGQVGQGTLTVHSWTERRSRCPVCRRTFAATTGTPFYRLQTEAALVLVVLNLLRWGCPMLAVVQTFAVDERTVAAWLQRAGQHCQQVHQHLVQEGQVDLQHVQADELWVKLVGQRVWQALALAVPSRLWLGGVLSPQRDTALITALVQQVRACASSLAILVCVDGLASYVTAFLRVFREPEPNRRCATARRRWPTHRWRSAGHTRARCTSARRLPGRSTGRLIWAGADLWSASGRACGLPGAAPGHTAAR
jgi:transposase-like protein